MKVKAKANLSGAVGDQAAGAEFTVDAQAGAKLIERGLVEVVEAPKDSKPEKTQGAE